MDDCVPNMSGFKQDYQQYPDNDPQYGIELKRIIDNVRELYGPCKNTNCEICKLSEYPECGSIYKKALEKYKKEENEKQQRLRQLIENKMILKESIDECSENLSDLKENPEQITVFNVTNQTMRKESSPKYKRECKLAETQLLAKEAKLKKLEADIEELNKEIIKQEEDESRKSCVDRLEPQIKSVAKNVLNGTENGGKKRRKTKIKHKRKKSRKSHKKRSFTSNRI